MPFSQVLPAPPGYRRVHDCAALQVSLAFPPERAESDADVATWRCPLPRSCSQPCPMTPMQQTDMDAQVQGQCCCYSAFVRTSTDGEVDRAMEHKLARHKYHRHHPGFIRISFVMALYVLSVVPGGLTYRLWVRSAIQLLGLAPGYFLMGFAAWKCKREFLRVSGTLREKVFVLFLSLQSILIVLAEWFRPDFDYGLLIMHIGFVCNFTPLSPVAMQVITVGSGFLPYCLLATLRYADSTRKVLILTTECLIGEEDTRMGQLRQRVSLPFVVLLLQITVSVRRERALRFEMLDGERLQRKRRVLSDEKNRIEGLLGSMLPPKIIQALQADEPIEPQLFSDVTVVFIEICDFHQLFRDLQPEDVLDMLNMIFCEFDRLCDDLPLVHKVETVMQVYVAVVGCPEPTKHHADLAARFAIAVQVSVVNLRKHAQHYLKAADEVAISIRVGLHSNPVRAGIVSMDSPRYRLIGDTVSIASRMERTCEPGKIQISSSTLQRLTPGIYLLEDLGPIPLKGRGTMHTAYLAGHNEGSPNWNNSTRIEQQHGQTILGKVTVPNLPCTFVSFDTYMPGDDFESEDEVSHGSFGHQWPNNKISSLSLQAWVGSRTQGTSGSVLTWWGRLEQAEAGSSMNSWWTHLHLSSFFVLESQKDPMKLRELQRDEAEFRKKGLPLQLNQAHKLTMLLLLVLSLLYGLECVLVKDADLFTYLENMSLRALTNYSTGLVYLMLISCPGMSRRLAQFLTFLMLSIQGSMFVVSSVYQIRNKTSVMLRVTIFSAYVMFYRVCSRLQRLAICAGTCGLYMLIRTATCEVQSSDEATKDATFLAIFVFVFACGMFQQENLELISHYKQVRVTKRVEEIGSSKAVTYHLLSSMLPPHVVSRVMDGHASGHASIVEHHSDVTIIFTSIKGFTAYSSTVTPQQLFTMLNSMYSALDELIANWGLHKVEIIGDGYCISAGCPEPALIVDHMNSYEYAIRAVELGLAMQRTLPSVVDATAVQMRVGIHTGAVYAGVVGEKGPRYHVFGPAVSYAEEIESCCIPGRVQISDATHQVLLKGGHYDSFEEREIYLEGQHQTQRTWLVKGSTGEMYQMQAKLLSQRRGSALKGRCCIEGQPHG